MDAILLRMLFYEDYSTTVDYELPNTVRGREDSYEYYDYKTHIGVL